MQTHDFVRIYLTAKITTTAMCYGLPYLNDALNKNGLWGTTANCERRCLRETIDISTSSTRMRPPVIELRRNKAFKMLDFPAPVLPMTPT